MATYIVRVELHGANELEYAALHAAMAKQGFSRILVSNGTKYQLPTAEYIVVSGLNTEAIRNAAKSAANSTRKTSWILVVQSAGMAWELPVVR